MGGEQSPAEMSDRTSADLYDPGTRVRIVHGFLEGFMGEIVASDPQRRVARVAIDLDDRQAVLEVRYCELGPPPPDRLPRC